jgi:lysophospholipase L1-like esterase
VFTRLTTSEDQIEEFGVMELQLPLGHDAPEQPSVRMNVENQSLKGYVDGQGGIRFRFSPKRSGAFEYTIKGNVPSLDGKTGAITALPTPPDAAQRPDSNLPNWWVDDPAPEYSEGPHIGAKTVSHWRKGFLVDFADRAGRCEAPAVAGAIRIMPLGDSITYDNRRKDMRPAGVRIAYRHSLAKLLESAGYKFDFVGSENAGYRYLGTGLDDNAGFPGITDDQLAVLIETGYSEKDSIQATPGPYLEAHPADIILLHIGTNRVEANADDVEDILDAIRTSEPNVYIVVARIINRYPYHEVTTAFNDAVETMVRVRDDERIIMVDMEDGAGIDYYTDMDDDLHPNHLGYDKMARAWFEALEPILSSPEFTTSTTQ